MVGGHSMGPGLQLVGARFLNFLLGKLSREFKLRRISIFHEIQMAIFHYCVMQQSHHHMVGHAGSPTRTVYVGVTLTINIHSTCRTTSMPKHVTVASRTMEIRPFEFREISTNGEV